MPCDTLLGVSGLVGVVVFFFCWLGNHQLNSTLQPAKRMWKLMGYHRCAGAIDNMVGILVRLHKTWASARDWNEFLVMHRLA